MSFNLLRYGLLTAQLATELAIGWLVLGGMAHAAEPTLDTLPRLDPKAPAGVNPYRGQATVLSVGKSAFESHCQRCHGVDGAGSAEAPDLRRLNSFCKRLTNPELSQRCLADVDTYFLRSVEAGKVRAGLTYMPAWKGILPKEVIWAIRSFTESRPLPPPRTLADLPPDGAIISTSKPPQ